MIRRTAVTATLALALVAGSGLATATPVASGPVVLASYPTALPTPSITPHLMTSGGSQSSGAGAGKVTVGSGTGAGIIQFIDQLLTLFFGGHG
jgi:hypothetical protein